MAGVLSLSPPGREAMLVAANTPRGTRVYLLL